jgi:hypothetical protein
MPRQELPPPLPPDTRTVGQVVAESLRLYGSRFWPSLALGIGPALTGVGLVTLPHSLAWALVPTVGTVVWAAAFVGACRLALAPSRKNMPTAFAIAFLAFLPLGITRVGVAPGSDLIAIAFFAFVALGVPAALVEGRGFRDSLRRGTELARADYVHALGSIAALVVTLFLSGLVLVFLLHSFSRQGVHIAAPIALLVLAPVLLLGTALLYVDQAARVVASGSRRRRRRAHADVHPALEPDASGRPDTEVEP